MLMDFGGTRNEKLEVGNWERGNMDQSTAAGTGIGGKQMEFKKKTI
jgi:hypothetical protein